MTQELLDLRASILEGRYEDALAIVDELEEMGKQAILRNIESFLIRLLIHLIKNQVEQRLTNSWVASIADSLRQIKKLNLKDNKKSYYIKQEQWLPFLEEAVELAIAPASVEVASGIYNPMRLSELVARDSLIITAQKFIDLTYGYSTKDLPTLIYQQLAQLPGGKEWLESR
jgi:hypothetical protein